MRSASPGSPLARRSPACTPTGSRWRSCTATGGPPTTRRPASSATAQPRPKTVGYRLTDPSAESARFPATLTVEEWSERGDREGDTLWGLYTNVHEDLPALEHVYDGPVMVLEGREPPVPRRAAVDRRTPARPHGAARVPAPVPRPHPRPARPPLPTSSRPCRGIRHCFDGYHGYAGLHVVLERARSTSRRRAGSRRPFSRRTGKPLKTGRTVRETRRLDAWNLPVPGRRAFADYLRGRHWPQWEEQVAFWTCQRRGQSANRRRLLRLQAAPGTSRTAPTSTPADGRVPAVAAWPSSTSPGASSRTSPLALHHQAGRPRIVTVLYVLAIVLIAAAVDRALAAACQPARRRDPLALPALRPAGAAQPATDDPKENPAA
jgi:hypothetical protein